MTRPFVLLTLLTLLPLGTVAVLFCACRGERPAAVSASTDTASVLSSSTARHEGVKASAGDLVPEGGPGGLPAPTAPQTTSGATWTFDADKPGAPPVGFSFGRTGSGKQGAWVVKAEAEAPSPPNLLAQVDADATDDRFPMAVADNLSVRDVRVSVRCKPIAGSVDQACGLVFRYRDENNYYLTRANALENNVRLYVVKNGHRGQLESWSGPVTGKAWHELRIDARGDHFEVYWNGKKVIDGRDRTFPDAGRIGVWTKADSVTYFDDLSATPL